MRNFLLPLAFLLIAAGSAPAPDPMRDRIIASAQTLSPASLAFERTTHVVQAGGGTRTETRRVDRWDGRSWSLVSINGKAPSASDIRQLAKTETGQSVPGYHRLAGLLSGTTERRIDAEGRMIITVPQLPSGTVINDGKDISAHLKAEAYVATSNGQPWVQQLRMTARDSFKMGWIKVLTFDQVSDYRLDQSGTPRLTSQNADSQGTLLGIPGGERREITYAYR
jgi:hypothetical protein